MSLLFKNYFRILINKKIIATKYNYAVINDTVDSAVQKINSIIIAEKCRVDRIKDNIIDSKEGKIHEQFYD